MQKALSIFYVGSHFSVPGMFINLVVRVIMCGGYEQLDEGKGAPLVTRNLKATLGTNPLSEVHEANLKLTVIGRVILLSIHPLALICSLLFGLA